MGRSTTGWTISFITSYSTTKKMPFSGIWETGCYLLQWTGSWNWKLSSTGPPNTNGKVHVSACVPIAATNKINVHFHVIGISIGKRGTGMACRERIRMQSWWIHSGLQAHHMPRMLTLVPTWWCNMHRSWMPVSLPSHLHLWQEVLWLQQWAYLQAHPQVAFSSSQKYEAERYTDRNQVKPWHKNQKPPLTRKTWRIPILMKLRLHTQNQFSVQRKVGYNKIL